MQAPFIPKHLKTWQPPRVVPRWCQWCAHGPTTSKEMQLVMVGPMRWYFCDDECLNEWACKRHARGWHVWLREPAATRAKVPTTERYARLTALGCEPTELCGLHNLDVPVPEGERVPLQELLSECRDSDSDHTVRE